MLKLVNTFFAVIVTLSPFIGFAHDTQSYKKRMCNDLEIIKNTFEVGYAPTEWKKTFAQWDLDDAITKAQVTVLAKDPLYVKDYQKIVKKFFQSTVDHHVGVRFCRTSAAFLPFRISSAEGRYFISWIDNQRVSSSIAIGDEITKYNGRPIDEVVQEFKASEYGESSTKSIQALAEIFFTCRIAAMGHTIPNPEETVQIITKRNENRLELVFQWTVLPEEISDGPFQLSKETFLTNHKLAKSNPDFFSKHMAAAFYEPMLEVYNKPLLKNQKADQEFPIGALKSMLPTLGEVIWKSDNTPHFDAYIFKTPRGKDVGFVRINTYSNLDEAAKEFSSLINRFQSQCDGLVIDQQNNPGGYIFYMYALGSMLSDQPLQLPTHRMTITQSDAFFAVKMLEELTSPSVLQQESNDVSSFIFGYPADQTLIQCFINHFKFIIQEWNAGRCFTNPAAFYGIEKLAVHPWGTFNKPILFLVNHLDFSCADFLPALLQDNKRATILGTTTAGAGGYVIGHSFPNKFGVANYTYTGSLVERLDKKVIENLGITPDIVCDLTANDLTHNFIDFRAKVVSVIDGMLFYREDRAEKERQENSKPIDETHYERPRPR
jgi:hypothetical protein